MGAERLERDAGAAVSAREPRLVTTLLLFALVSACTGRQTVARSTTASPSQVDLERGHLVAGALRMHVQRSGSGSPVVFLPGALTTADLARGNLTRTLERTNRLLVVEVDGHGRTPPTAGPLDYDRMAGHLATGLRAARQPAVTVVGHSMGANIGLALAMRHPDLVARLVLLSPTFHPSGVAPESRRLVVELEPEHFESTPMQTAHDRVAPAGSSFPELVRRVRQMEIAFRGWPRAAIAAISVPTLIVVGDSDDTLAEHAVDLFRLLGGGRTIAAALGGAPDPHASLLVVPSADHLTVVHHPLTVDAVAAFLASTRDHRERRTAP